MIRSHKYRIYPTASQSEKLGEMLLCFCRLYNAALESRIDAYRKAGVTISYNEQAASLKEIREFDQARGKPRPSQLAAQQLGGNAA